MTTPRFTPILATAAALFIPFAQAQTTPGRTEVPAGYITTQMLVRSDAKGAVIPNAQSLTLELDRHQTPVVSLNHVQPSGTQVALLIDDGLSRSAGIQLNDLKAFLMGLPAGTEVLVGYMQNGTVRIASPFSTDHQAAIAALRLPMGIPGQSASPYFCLSEFVKQWPSQSEEGGTLRQGKARFVMMITNGVDPYNGSDSITNQNSPYVAAAVNDAQRAGVAVSSIYYRDAGFRGGRASFSGQGYLQQVADGTGGEAYFEGTGSPVSLAPFLDQFTHAISETYVATFSADGQAGGREHLVQVKLKSNGPNLKLRAPSEIRPGNRESALETTAMVAQP